MPRRRDLEHAAEDLHELFSDLWRTFAVPRAQGYRPQVDVFRTDDPPEMTILVELPGVDPDEVKLIAAPRALVIAGERRRPKGCGHYQHMEVEYGPFQRRVMLTEDVDPDAATATYERGFLRIVLPVAPKPEPRESVAIIVRTTL